MLSLIKQKIMHNPVKWPVVSSNNQLKRSSVILTSAYRGKELSFCTFRVALGRDYHSKFRDLDSQVNVHSKPKFCRQPCTVLAATPWCCAPSQEKVQRSMLLAMAM